MSDPFDSPRMRNELRITNDRKSVKEHLSEIQKGGTQQEPRGVRPHPTKNSPIPAYAGTCFTSGANKNAGHRPALLKNPRFTAGAGNRLSFLY